MIELKDIEFRYGEGPFSLRVPALTIERGEQVAVIGPSGSGKTSLLNLIAGVLVPHAGEIRVGENVLNRMGDAQRRAFRIARVGMVFQEFELLEYLRVWDNMLLPYRIHPALKLDEETRQSIRTLAERVGVGKFLHRFPSKLSQGERQRVAICRALGTRPGLILADEPTGNLDPATSQTIVDLLLEQAKTREATVLMVTHDHGLLDRFQRVVDLKDFPELDMGGGP